VHRAAPGAGIGGAGEAPFAGGSLRVSASASSACFCFFSFFTGAGPAEKTLDMIVEHVKLFSRNNAFFTGLVQTASGGNTGAWAGTRGPGGQGAMRPGGGRRRQARVWLGLLLPLAMLRGFASHEGSHGPALASAVPCGFVPAHEGRMGLWQCGRAVAACFSARLSTRTCPPRGPTQMQSGGGGDRAAGSSMNELERAREALAGIIAKRKGQSRGGLAGTAASPGIGAPAAPRAAAPETLGAKMAATFPPKAPAQDPAGPIESAPSAPPSAVPANRHADSGGAAGGASPKTPQASPMPVQRPEPGDAGPPQKKKGRRAVAAAPPVDWVVPEHAWSIVDKNDQGVVQAKMNLQEFEAANGGWADGQDWAVDTNYAKGSEAPAAAQLGKIRRGKGAGEQAKVNEMFRRAKFIRGEAKMMSKTNWKDDWLDTFDRAESAPSEDVPGADASRTLQARGQEARSLSDNKVGAGSASWSEAERFAQEARRPVSMGSMGERRAGRDEEEPTTVTHAGLEEAEVERDLHDASQEQEFAKDQQLKAQRGEAGTGQPAVAPPLPPTFASHSPPPSPVTSSSTPPPPPRPSSIDMNPSSHADGDGDGGSRLGGDGGGGGGRGGMGGGGGGGGSTSTVSARSLTTAAAVTFARSETPASSAPAVSNVQALQPAQATSASFSTAASLAAAPAPPTTLPAPRLTPSSPERGPLVVHAPESSSAPSTTSTSARASPSVSGGGGGGGGGAGKCGGGGRGGENRSVLLWP